MLVDNLVVSLGHDDPVCLPGLHSWSEELVHSLKRDSLSLWQDEVDEEDGEDHERGEEVEEAVEMHGGERLRSESRDDECKEPVGGGDQSLGGWTNVLGEDFRSNDPWGAVPSRAVEASPDVEESHSRNTSGGQRLVRVLGGVGDVDVGSDVPHGKGTTDATDEEDRTTSEAIDEDEKPDDSSKEFENTEDTGGEQRGVGTSDTDGLEYGGLAWRQKYERHVSATLEAAQTSKLTE